MTVHVASSDLSKAWCGHFPPGALSGLPIVPWTEGHLGRRCGSEPGALHSHQHHPPVDGTCPPGTWPGLKFTLFPRLPVKFGHFLWV